MLSHSYRRADEARGPPPFAEWMARALYDPDHRYYAAGRVAFGTEAHFVTWPERASPHFGRMVAALARDMLQALAPPAAPVLLDLGAGEGGLAVDVLDALEPEGAAARYVVGEVSPALRWRQRARLGPRSRPSSSPARRGTYAAVDAGPARDFGLEVAGQARRAVDAGRLGAAVRANRTRLFRTYGFTE